MNEFIHLLALETSCDDTSLALVRGKEQDEKFDVLFFQSFSQEAILRPWGGIVPEIAARNHIDKIFPLLQAALSQNQLSPSQLNLLAVTQGPGLLGPLLTGINTVKALSLFYQLPVIGVNHLFAHLEAVHFDQKIDYPYIGCVISGGHTFFALVESAVSWHLLGSTVDDALGEALDKGGKLLGLNYPAGKILDALFPWGDHLRFSFSLGMQHNKDSCAVSYSGIKNALRVLLEKNPAILENKPKQFEAGLSEHQLFYDVASSYMHGCLETLIQKIPIAYQMAQQRFPFVTGKTPLVFGGGVAMSLCLKSKMQKSKFPVHFASPALCTDNALMIATLAWKTRQQQLPYPQSLNLDAYSRFLDRKNQHWMQG